MYKEHIVAFIDLLGFSQLLKDKPFSEMNMVVEEFTKRVMNFEEFNSTMLHYNIEENHRILLKEKYAKLSFFSDCVVWSYPVEKLGEDFAKALESIVLAFSYLQYELYERGIVLRGGISIGDFYADENKTFGYALVKAYELENKMAVYPRIVIDKEIVQRCQVSYELYQYLNKSLTKDQREVCGIVTEFYYIDLIKEIEETIKSFQTIGGAGLIGMIDKRLITVKIDAILNIMKIGMKNPNGKVKEKYQWLLDKMERCSNTFFLVK
jgi:hypothetical protein